MPPIKSLSDVSAKWKRVASAAAAEYEAGVKAPRKSWAEETAKSEAAYNAGIQAAIGRKSFAAGVRAAGDAKWARGAILKGPMRFAQGIELSEDNYAKGFEPYHRAISALNLPARGPKGDPKNIQRVVVIAKALHDLKLQLSS